jgi:hypothetical protein
MEQVMDTEPPHRLADTSHRVSFEQVCRIVATNTPGGQIRLDLEVVSLGMERSKSGQVATGFDSEQGGEVFDDHGYVPVLRRLVGGKMRFLVSPEGRVLKADGVSEWVERALGPGGRAASVRRLLSTNAVRTLTVVTNADGTTRTNVETSVRLAARPGSAEAAGAGAPAAAPAVRSSVASAVRTFFTVDLFKQFLEFSFLPSAAVRPGERWTVQGETPFVGRGKPRYNAGVTFTGWQRQRGTNCARLDFKGTIAQRASRSAKQDGTLHGSAWIDVEAQFPNAMVLFKDAAFPASANAKASDTNEVADAAAPKRIQQSVAFHLLSVRPTAEAAAP